MHATYLYPRQNNNGNIILNIQAIFKKNDLDYQRSVEALSFRNTKDRLVWTERKEDSLSEVHRRHRIPRAWKDKGATRKKSAHRNISERRSSNMEKYKLGSEKVSPRQGLTYVI